MHRAALAAPPATPTQIAFVEAVGRGDIAALNALAASDASWAGEVDVSCASQARVAPLARMLPSTARTGSGPSCQAIVSHSPEAGSARPLVTAMTDDPVP